jgi:uncharacterized protein (TIGR02118 family)
MVKLVFCCRRKEGTSLEEFQKRWLEVHGPLVKRLRADLPMMKRYVQSHLLPGAASDGLRASRGAAEPYDGITEVWFDDLESTGGGGGQAAIDAGRALLEDEAKFLDLSRCAVFMTEEKEIF